MLQQGVSVLISDKSVIGYYPVFPCVLKAILKERPAALQLTDTASTRFIPHRGPFTLVLWSSLNFAAVFDATLTSGCTAHSSSVALMFLMHQVWGSTAAVPLPPNPLPLGDVALLCAPAELSPWVRNAPSYHMSHMWFRECKVQQVPVKVPPSQWALVVG